jgi:hypothetical protein
MATTTPNYGWTVPTSTDLVKDGATAIETLGDAIDASMNTALGTKKAGMVLLNTTSFSAVSSIALPANSFTTTYDNYRILLQFDSVSTSLTVSARMRAAGVDASGATDYYNHQQFTSASSVTASTSSTSSFTLNTINSGAVTHINIFDFFNPALAKKTYGIYQNFQYSSSNAWFLNFYGLNHQVATAYDSMNFIASTGNFTGTISLYGYNK